MRPPLVLALGFLAAGPCPGRAQLPEGISFKQGPINSVVITRGGQRMVLYRGSNSAQAVLLTHARRDLVESVRAVAEGAELVVAPEKSREALNRAEEFWQGFWDKRFNYYGQQVNKLPRRNLEVDRFVKEGATIRWQELEFEVTRGIINIPAVRPERVGEDYKVLYLKFSTFMQDDTVDEMRQALEENDDAEAIVIGVRFNPGGQVLQCIRVLSLFIEEGVLVKMRQRIPYRGFQTTVYRLTKDKLIVERTIEDTGKTFSQEMPRDPYLAGNKPVVVLTDKWSASASEMLAGALKDHGRATLIGKTTYGKGIGQTPQPLLEGTVAVVTSLRYFSPNGHWAGDAHKEKIGIAPHIEVDLPEGVMPGSPEDAQLNRALEVIEEQLKG